MTAIGATLICLSIIAIFFLPKKWVAVAMLAAALYIPEAQQLQVAGFYIFSTRFVELAGFIRSKAYRKLPSLLSTPVDRSLVLLIVYTTTVFVLRSHQDIPYRIGIATDAFLSYFTFRSLITNIDEFRETLIALAVTAIPFAFLLFIERRTSSDPFACMGAFDRWDYTRNGKIRCFSSFMHPSLLGTVGGTLFPLYVGLFASGYKKAFSALGMAICLLIVWATNSGAPISCIGLGVLGWMCWRIRTKMQVVRRAIVAALLIMDATMKSSLWYLPMKLSAVTGGDGYHRSYLMDVAFKDIQKWGLFGMSLQNTVTWFPTHLDSGVSDITNAFISYGLQAGLLSMALFIALFVRTLSYIGRAMAMCRASSSEDKAIELTLWGLGVMIVIHALNLIGITYYDQSYFFWYMQLACVSSVCAWYVNGTQISVDLPTQTASNQIDGALEPTSL